MTYDPPPPERQHGTERARQTDDPTLSDSESRDPVGPTTAVDDSRPWVMFAAGFLVLFLVVLGAALILGVL